MSWHRRVRPYTEAFGDVETEQLEEKEKLPASPTPGRTYRNVARRWRFSTWLRQRSR